MNELIPASPFPPSPATRATVFEAVDGKKHSTQEEALRRNHYLAFAHWRMRSSRDKLHTHTPLLYDWLIKSRKEVSEFLDTLPSYIVDK